MRVVVKFERVRHDHEIDAVGGERQFAQVAQDVDLPPAADGLTQRDAVVGQQIELRHTQLQGVVAEEIGDHGRDLLLLPAHDVAALGRGEPGIHSGN